MGWYGSWDIKYNGQDSQKFVNLAKLIIPNYVKRFEETEKGKLECKRNLSWYNADVDISKIMEYLSDTDIIDVTIDGETHPISGTRKLSEEEAEWEDYDYEENGEYYVYEEYDDEKQTFKKQNGEVVLDNEHPDKDRWKSSNLGVQEMLTYYIAYPQNAKESELEGNTDTVNSYINYIAQQFAGNDDIMPAVQDFVYSIFDPQKLKDLTNKEYNRYSNRLTPDEKTLSQIARIREQFKTVESTKSYLEQVKLQNPEAEKQEKTEERTIPNFIANMSKRDINNLGGLEQLLKLVDVKGEDSAKEFLSILGYKINDSKVLEQPSLEDLEFEKTTLEDKEQKAKQLYQEYEGQLPNREDNISIE